MSRTVNFDLSIGRGDVSGLNVRRAVTMMFLFLAGFYFCILLTPVLVNHGGITFFADPDTYWHVAAGRSIWRSWTFPHFDQWSHTFRGQPWIAKEWLSQLLLFSAYALAGWRGVALLAVSVIALTYGLLFVILARQMRLSIAAGVATIALVFSLGHFTVRPQIFVDALIILWVASLIRAVETHTPPSWLLLPVLVLWANLHASFTFGPGLAVLLATEATFGSRRDLRFQTAKQWSLFIIAAIAVTCITPYGYQPMLATFNVFVGNDTLKYIQEWKPATPGTLDVYGIILFGLLFLALYNGVKLPFWRLLLITGLTYLMLAHVRFGGLFAIVAPLALATPLTNQFPKLSLRWQVETEPTSFQAATRVFQYAASVVVVVLATATTSAVTAKKSSIAPNRKITPTGAVDYIANHHLTGNIYNPMEFGGYLIFRSIPTFIDGRNDQLFFGGFGTRLFSVTSAHPSQFIDYLAGFNTSLALVTPNSMEAEELARSQHWELVYSDDISLLFQKLN
jgi:hypothetical protein